MDEAKGGKTRKISKFGSRRKVFNGSAMMTTGGLRKENLIKNPRGRIVSTKRHTFAKERGFRKMESSDQKQEIPKEENDQ
jgi:hypothetical protein